MEELVELYNVFVFGIRDWGIKYSFSSIRVLRFWSRLNFVRIIFILFFLLEWFLFYVGIRKIYTEVKLRVIKS